MKVLIKCKCTDGEVEFSLRDRRPEEDIRDYMEHIQIKLSEWHTLRHCPEPALEYLKMPMIEGKGIGVS